MPTIREKRVAQNLIESAKTGKPQTAQQIVEKSGYAKETARGHAGEIIRGEGVQTALEELGFTEDAAKSVVAEILHDKKAKKNDRLKAADMVFKVRGTYAPEKSMNLNLTADAKDFEQYSEISDKFNEEMRKKSLE